MVKHTQVIRRQKPTNCLSVFDHFLGLTVKVLKNICKVSDEYIPIKLFGVPLICAIAELFPSISEVGSLASQNTSND